MKIIAIAAVSAAALALASCGPKNGTAVGTGNDTTAMASDNSMAAAPAVSGGQAFANAAAASDAFEIATSRLALTNGASAAVKAYAQKMIDAHTNSTAKLQTAAASASPSLTPNPALTAEQESTLASLKTATGKAFDQAYAAAQVAGHQKTLDALRAYDANGDVPALKAFATTLTPTVAAHLNMAKSLKV